MNFAKGAVHDRYVWCYINAYSDIQKIHEVLKPLGISTVMITRLETDHLLLQVDHGYSSDKSAKILEVLRKNNLIASRG